MFPSVLGSILSIILTSKGHDDNYENSDDGI